MVDGVGSVDVEHILLDTEPATPRPPDGRAAPPPEIPRGRSSVDVVTGGLARGALPIAARAGARHRSVPACDIARASARDGALATARGAMAELLVRDEINAAPRTSLNVPIGGRPRARRRHVPLDELKAIKRGLGGKVNDVVLAAAAGGLRALLLERGEEPPERRPAGDGPGQHPQRRRARSRSATRSRSLFVDLPVAEPDPLRRYRLQPPRGSAQGRGQAVGARALIDFTAHAPPVVHSFLARSMYATRLFNVTITNVPGPPRPLYAFGSRPRRSGRSSRSPPSTPSESRSSATPAGSASA